MPARGLGVTGAVARFLPEFVRELFALITHLGDAGLLLAAVALCYWFGDRREGAFSLAAVLGALALTLALKGLFELPRPPAGLHVGHAGGYGFPSGHAIGATTLWGLLALVLERGSPHRRAVAAASVVAVVATSRLVIGVHYAVDVAVGVVVALVYLGALLRIADWNPTRAFAVAAGLTAAALATNGLTPDSVATLAGVVGAAAAWAALGALDARPRGAVTLPAAAVGLGALGLVGYAGNRPDLSLAAVFGLNLLVPAGILLLPSLVERARRSRSASPT
ncbi:phosphatase PAP2 family protein [Halorussus sp. AFM4]|uniref:phosphatase PAP2 family protein n=1 Tax=Halorussus sp. AFM4 TaxID=3421651 RepID=UPI003EB6B434